MASSWSACKSSSETSSTSRFLNRRTTSLRRAAKTKSRSEQDVLFLKWFLDWLGTASIEVLFPHVFESLACQTNLHGIDMAPDIVKRFVILGRLSPCPLQTLVLANKVKPQKMSLPVNFLEDVVSTKNSLSQLGVQFLRCAGSRVKDIWPMSMTSAFRLGTPRTADTTSSPTT